MKSSNSLVRDIGMLEHEYGVLMVLNCLMTAVLIGLALIWWHRPQVVVLGVPGAEGMSESPIHWRGKAVP